MALYNANCSGCHGSSKASDPKVNTASKLASVLSSVATHKSMGLDTRFADQALLDIAAYVSSAK